MVTVFPVRLTSLFSVLNRGQILEAGTISALLALSFHTVLCVILCLLQRALQRLKYIGGRSRQVQKHLTE